MSNDIKFGWFLPAGCIADVDSLDVDMDVMLKPHYKEFEAKKFQFICYPVGGIERYCWKPKRDAAPPKINLPDLQMESVEWMTHVNCCLSPWIDPDSEVDWIADISISHLESELSYSAYLGIQSIVIQLKHVHSPRLARVIHKWLWEKSADFSFWIILPTNITLLHYDGTSPTIDIWSVWAEFRRLCENYPSNLFVGIKFSEDTDEEFYVPELTNRWKTEPVAILWFDSAIFVSNVSNLLASDAECKPSLSEFYLRFLKEIWTDNKNPQYVLCSSLDRRNTDWASQFVNMFRQSIASSSLSSHTLEIDATRTYQSDFVNALQDPLQPLSVNLSSTIYNTFERDNVKYDYYREAIRLAIKDLSNEFMDRNFNLLNLTAFVVGAGRGPLVTLLLDVEEEFLKLSDAISVQLDIWAVEKNPNACISLQYMNSTRWKNRVNILNCDMRDLRQKHLAGVFRSPNIVVSELLGSFADNELSPECLDGLTSIMTKDCICIPQGYRSYVAPIQSLKLHQSVVSENDKKNVWSRKNPGTGRFPQNSANPTDNLYVACLPGDFCLLACPKLCFQFVHPNWKMESNVRQSSISFSFNYPCELMGFAGFFDTCLYKSVSLSTLPGQHTEGMVSWFPALIPLRDLLPLSDGMTVDFHISRKFDEGGVWYEWFLEYKDSNGQMIRTEIQNQDGNSQYLKLQSE